MKFKIVILGIFVAFMCLSMGAITEMKVDHTHKIDKGEKNENGYYDFYYEYDLYTFCEDSICFHARSYADEKNEAHIYRKTIGGALVELDRSDASTNLFEKAVSHLKDIGKEKINILTKRGYEAL